MGKTRNPSNRGKVLALLLVGGLLVPAAGAAPEVRVLALFPGKAMLQIDGERRVLAAGETGPAGVRLLEADSREAVVEIDGSRETLTLGSAVSATYRPSERRSVRIVKDRSGSYHVDGTINGQPVRFLVDTGATSVALSERHAARLGIPHRVEGQRIGVGTASGRAVGHAVTLDSLSVGGLRLTDVRAVVIDGDSPPNVLLGMSALKAFEMEQRENLLILRSKF